MEMQVLNIPVAEILNMLIMLLGVAIVIIAAIMTQMELHRKNLNLLKNSVQNAKRLTNM